MITIKRSSEYQATIQNEGNDKGSYRDFLFPTSCIEYAFTDVFNAGSGK